MEAFESMGLKVNLLKINFMVNDGIAKDALSKSTVNQCVVNGLRVKANLVLCVHLLDLLE